MVPRPGDLIGGKYRVERHIGEGGMGVVLAARHETSGSAHAIKLLADHTDPVLRERFMREAQAAATLRSEHVTRIHDVGELPGGQPYLVMDLLVGRDLDAVLQAEGRLAAPDAVTYVLSACEALAEAHARGMVHRDVKPANLFLAESAGRRVVKLLDFGISKIATHGGVALTSTGDILGSPCSMAPEQVASSRTVDARADIWSVGATLFELLSGEIPFEGQTVGEILSAVLRDPPRSLAALAPEVPADLVRVVHRCLEKDPADRYQEIGALVRELAPFASDAVPSLPFAHTAVGIAPTLAAVAPTLPQTVTSTPALALPADRRSPARVGWWVAAGMMVVGAVTAGAYVVARGQRVDEETVTAKRRPRKSRREPEAVPQPTASPTSSDEERLSADTRQAVEAHLAEGERYFAVRSFELAGDEADAALLKIYGAGLVPGDHRSFLASRAATLKGRAHAARAHPRATEEGLQYYAALGAFGEAMMWDHTGQVCPSAEIYALHMRLSDQYAVTRHFRKAARDGYGATATSIERDLTSPNLAESCKARLRVLREVAVQRGAEVPLEE